MMKPGSARWFTVACGCCGVFCAVPSTAGQSPAALAARIHAAMRRLQSLSASITFTQVVDGRTITTPVRIWLRKPNECRLVVGAPYNEVLADTGKTLTRFMTKSRQYSQASAAPDGADIQVASVFPVQVFFRPLKSLLSVPVRPTGVGTGVVGGVRTAILIESGSKSTAAAVLHLQQRTYARSDGVVVRSQTIITEGKHRIVLTSTLSNIHVNNVSSAQLHFALPADAQSASAAPADPYDKSLVAIGAQAPPFQLPLPGGGDYSLKQALDGRKAVLVNFWFYS
ncbi:MAG: hypothetical protein KGJ62_09825 [Armatimonadetes bacterium]|nr:hypothetical protein [Armatimonadota bacterium]MDE2207980.1 hypothetical protein [Armatimonadota bacterium]